MEKLRVLLCWIPILNVDEPECSGWNDWWNVTCTHPHRLHSYDMHRHTHHTHTQSRKRFDVVYDNRLAPAIMRCDAMRCVFFFTIDIRGLYWAFENKLLLGRFALIRLMRGVIMFSLLRLLFSCCFSSEKLSALLNKCVETLECDNNVTTRLAIVISKSTQDMLYTANSIIALNLIPIDLFEFLPTNHSDVKNWTVFSRDLFFPVELTHLRIKS